MHPSDSSSSLYDLLAAELPQGLEFKFYHLSTPPTKCAPLFSPPPGHRPERTYCECHFLNVSITPKDSDAAGKEVLVLAIEVLTYTTKHLTTVFVSKADSTGYLSLLALPRTQASPLRSITTTFLSYLIRHKQRQHVRLVLTLFARAADQYLFPGSVENPTKHVSDDRQLIKWWLRVLDPLLPQAPSSPSPSPPTAQAFITVPGEDSIASFLPSHVRSDPNLRSRWKHGHPLREISSFGPTAPPRCLVPHFPDDPKARYLDELDEELRDAGPPSQVTESPSKRGSGQWRSVRSLEEFWELMVFRQECSSGRLVGFVWVVFTPPEYEEEMDDLTAAVTASPSKQKPELRLGDGFNSQVSFTSSFGTNSSFSSTQTASSSLHSPPSSPRRRRKPDTSTRKPRLTGPIIPRSPRIKKTTSTSTLAPFLLPPSSAHYSWSPAGRDQIILPEKAYKKAIEMLLRLDFSTRHVAEASTGTWIAEVGILGGLDEGLGWGRTVVGRNTGSYSLAATAEGGVNGLVVKKRKALADEGAASRVAVSGEHGSMPVNVLGAGMVRKRPRVDGEPNGAVSAMVEEGNAATRETGVNVLGAGLVRKKSKTEGRGDRNGGVGNNEQVVAPTAPAPAPATATATATATAAPLVNVLGPGLVRKKPKA